MIHWIERSPELYEARLTLPDGHDAYAGYVATTPGQVAWRGYVGPNFAPLGMGPRTEMQTAVAQMVTEILQHGSDAQQRALLDDGGDGGQVYGGEDSAL